MRGAGARSGQACGVTLIEMLLAVGLLGLLLGLAQPSLQDLLLRRRLLHAAETYQNHVHWARGMALRHQRTVHIALVEDARATCYLIQFAPPRTCGCGDTAPDCLPGGEPLLAWARLPASERVVLRPKNLAWQTWIDPALGTFQPGLTAVFATPDGREVHQVTNTMGRTRGCVPDGPWFGLPRC